MNRRSKKAWKTVAIVAICLSIPVGFLAYLHRTNVTVDVDGFGVVPEFAYNFVNDPVGITHFDTEKYPMVIAVLRDACKDGCPKIMDQLSSLQSYIETELKFPTSYKIRFPRTVRLVAMTESEIATLPEAWDQAVIGPDQAYLVPEVKKDDLRPAIVLIDDSSFFRGFIPFEDEQADLKLRRELTRIVSQQSLMHYVTQQTLMWQKAKGRSLKEDEKDIM